MTEGFTDLETFSACRSKADQNAHDSRGQGDECALCIHYGSLLTSGRSFTGRQVHAAGTFTSRSPPGLHVVLFHQRPEVIQELFIAFFLFYPEPARFSAWAAWMKRPHLLLCRAVF